MLRSPGVEVKKPSSISWTFSPSIIWVFMTIAKPQARMAISSAVIGCLSDLLYISASQFQQLLLQLTLDAAELDLCLGAFLAPSACIWRTSSRVLMSS